MASFRKRNGKWEYRIKYQDPFTRKTKEKSKMGFATKKEAQLAAHEEEKRLLEGHEYDPVMLKDFLITWLEEYKKGTIRDNTYELHERNIKNHIVPYFKNIKLLDVKPIMYQKFLNHLTDKGYSRRTVEIIHGTMFNALSKAVTLSKLEKNPCDGATIKGEKKEQQLMYMDSSDISLFLQEAYKYEYNYWLFFKVLIETGMRKGEAAAIQWPDVDLKNKTISINKTLHFNAKSKEKLFGDTKTYHSRRVITISNGLANALQFHKKYQNQNKVALNAIYHHNLNLVLCRNDGNFLPKSTLFNAFSRILKRAELSELPIHSLRHTHAVLLLESGASMKYIQERLGHGSMQITADVYAHISKKIESETLNNFEIHMNEILQ